MKDQSQECKIYIAIDQTILVLTLTLLQTCTLGIKLFHILQNNSRNNLYFSQSRAVCLDIFRPVIELHGIRLRLPSRDSINTLPSFQSIPANLRSPYSSAAGLQILWFRIPPGFAVKLSGRMGGISLQHLQGADIHSKLLLFHGSFLNSL